LNRLFHLIIEVRNQHVSVCQVMPHLDAVPGHTMIIDLDKAVDTNTPDLPARVIAVLRQNHPAVLIEQKDALAVDMLTVFL